MRLRFIGSGDPTDNDVCVAFGLTFPVNQWVEVNDPPAKLLGNPTFEASETPAPVIPHPLDRDGDGRPGGSRPGRRNRGHRS